MAEEPSIFQRATRREPGDRAERAAVQETSDDESGDALRRTRLANERTYLAWWRTGLTAFAVSLGAGKLIPELSTGASWPFEAIGTAFGIVGIALMLYAYTRQKQVEAAISRGEYARFDPRASLGFAVIGALLGVATILVVLVESA
jgi:putative membrane protein